MGRRGRMNGQATRFADIGLVVEELKAVDESASNLAAPHQFEADEAAKSPGIGVAIKVLTGNFDGSTIKGKTRLWIRSNTLLYVPYPKVERGSQQRRVSSEALVALRTVHRVL